jgi:hypothetical protein
MHEIMLYLLKISSMMNVHKTEVISDKYNIITFCVSLHYAQKWVTK